MPVLGADALGQQALGQLNTVPAQTPQTSFSFGYNFSQPRYTPRPPQEGAIDFRILRPDAATPGPLVFTRFSEPDLSKKTSVQAHTSPVFRTLRPDAATPTALVFTKFSEPYFSKTTTLDKHTSTVFRILRPDAATTGPLVFSRFSEPSKVTFKNSDVVNAPVIPAAAATPVVPGGDFADFDLLKSRPVPQYGFTNAPIALQTQPYVFSKFSEPSKVTSKNSDVSNVPVFITPTATVVTGGGFSKFDLPSKTKAVQSDFSNTPIVPTAAPVVITAGNFSDFGLASTKSTIDRNFSNFLFVPPVQPYVFSTFSQPSFKKVPQADGLFLGDLGPAQTPTWSTFPQFKELLTKKPQQDPSIGFIGDLGPAQTPSRLAFTDFEGISSKRPLEGYITSTSPPAVQNYVFSKFDQPVYKRILHPDQSFVNFPVVAAAVQPYVFSTFGQPQVKRLVLDDKSFVNFPVVIAAVQPYLFSDFGQPQQTKRPIIDDRSFLNFPIVVAQQQPYVFSDFGQPQYKAVLKEGQVTFNGSLGPAIVPPWFVFGQSNQPQLIRPRVDGFTNTPDFTQVQPYVFGQFDQPRQLIRVVPGFTNNQTFIAPQSYVFSPFEQPSVRRTLQIDSVQFVDNTPTVIVLTPDFSYSDFGIPFYSKQTGISFTNAPLQPIIAPDNSAPFSGFTSFVIQLPGQYHIEQHPGVVYEILVPDVLVEDVIAGKRWKVQTRQAPKTVPVVSSHISEVTFDKDSNELNVKFNNGSVYNYANVDSKKAKGLVRAKSSGKYLHNNIKGKYHTTRIK